MKLPLYIWVLLIPAGASQMPPDDDEYCTSPETCASELERRKLSSPDCKLYLGPSNNKGALGLFSGIALDKLGAALGPPELVVSIIDANKMEQSLWHPYVWAADISETLIFESEFGLDAFVPGLGTHVQCHETWNNVYHNQDSQDSTGVHRSTHPSAGTFTYRHNYTTHAFRAIKKGQELFVSCNGDISVNSPAPAPMTIDWLEEHAICIDNLKPGVSTIPGAGRGAFTSRFASRGSIVTTSPLLHFDKREMDILEQSWTTTLGNDDDVVFDATSVYGQQLLTNYLFGHSNSSVALLPTAPVVNYINHSPQPNVAIQWGSKLFTKEYLAMDPSVLFSEPRGLSIDYVALRNIEPGEELFLDYGSDWTSAWEDYVVHWDASDPSYESASEYAEHQEWFRTESEQEEDPYPENIQTVCHYKANRFDDVKNKEFVVKWAKNHLGCLRPCEILDRVEDDETTYYTAIMYPVESHAVSSACYLNPSSTHTVTHIPEDQIKLVDRMYTLDYNLPDVFRHMIGVPPSLYPEIWMKKPILHEEAFAAVPLKANELSQVKWAKTNEPVSKYAYRLGLDPKVSKALLDYCNRIGITDAFRYLLVHGNPLQPGKDLHIPLGDYNWYIQRPQPHWKSNMHWISPADEDAHEDYLRVLSEGGFDDVLASIGNHFGFEGLVVYHVTFIGVSHCSKGLMHHDFKNVNGKAFNIIIPLILVNETGPELELKQDEVGPGVFLPVGNYKYENNVASMVGDDASHATATCDYRDSGEMRMAATVYIADVNELNLKSLIKDFTQAFPPPGDEEHLMRRAGTHWKPNGSVKLPRPFIALDMPIITESELAPMQWEVGTLTKYAARVDLGPDLARELRIFLSHMGIAEYIQETIVGQDYLTPGGQETTDFQGYNWTVQRPADNSSNLHWLFPGDETAHNHMLTILSTGGFDDIIERIGLQYELNSISVFSVALMAVSRNAKSYEHVLPDSGGKNFEVLVPIFLGENIGPELEIWSDDKQIMGPYYFEENVGVVLGDGAIHSVRKCDYRVGEQMLLIAQILLGDITDENNILESAGLHWSRVDQSKKLPVPVTAGDFIANPLDPFEISPVRWLESGEIVTEYAFRVGLPERLSKELLDYCDRTGITDAFRQLLIDGEPLEAGKHRFDDYGGYQWYVQRPEGFWKSNMHWISPANRDTHQDYLRVLSAGGFDDLLNSIGSYFEHKGLVVYHVTFIGVSKCETGYMHYDFKETGGGKAFNVIIPLILANKTGPELDIQQANSNLVGRYKYEPNVASMVGDIAYHATSAVDYLDAKEMRMAATVYIADLNIHNVEAIVNDFTQAYPPRGDIGFLMRQAGSHWSPNDNSKRLPVQVK